MSTQARHLDMASHKLGGLFGKAETFQKLLAHPFMASGAQHLGWAQRKRRGGFAQREDQLNGDQLGGELKGLFGQFLDAIVSPSTNPCQRAIDSCRS